MKPKKTVIITGTSRGIGFELVHLFSKAGYAVLALSRNAKPVINLNYENITALSFDLNNVEAEIGVLEYIYNRIVKGGIIIFDDYGWVNYKMQLQVEKEFLEKILPKKL